MKDPTNAINLVPGWACPLCGGEQYNEAARYGAEVCIYTCLRCTVLFRDPEKFQATHPKLGPDAIFKLAEANANDIISQCGILDWDGAPDYCIIDPPVKTKKALITRTIAIVISVVLARQKLAFVR